MKNDEISCKIHGFKTVFPLKTVPCPLILMLKGRLHHAQGAHDANQLHDSDALRMHLRSERPFGARNRWISSKNG